MAYSTQSDVRTALAPGIADPTQPPVPPSNTAADLSNAELTAAIAEADAIVDSYIGGRYTTPVAPVDNTVPEPVPFLSATIAAYLATLTYRRGQDLSPTDPVALRYATAMNLLTAVSKGATTLPIPVQGGDSSQSAVGSVNNAYVGALFTSDDFRLAYVWPRTDPSWPGAAGRGW